MNAGIEAAHGVLGSRHRTPVQTQTIGFRLGRAELALSVAVAACALAVGRVYPLWQDHVHVACPLLEISGIPCPTCGATRAVTALAAGRVFEALSWNPLAALGAATLLVWIPAAALMLCGAVASPRIPTSLRPWVRWAFPLLIGANWVYLLVWFKG